MKSTCLYNRLTRIGLDVEFLTKQINILNKKRVTKRDPYDVLHSVLAYLYCIRDKDSLSVLFDEFIASDINFHFEQSFDIWSYVERGILLYADLLVSSCFDQFIADKGFVRDRLEGRLLELHRQNLQKELGELSTGHSLPKETIVRRYQSLIAECLLIIRFKKTGWFGSHKEIKAHLNRYCLLCRAAMEHFGEPDEQFIAFLEVASPGNDLY